MEDYIVRVKSKSDDHIEYGTGISISENMIITPSHVVIGQKHYIIVHEKEYKANIISNNEHIAILRIDDNILKYTDIFSDEEILDEDSEWFVHGYISATQIPHEISGKGLHVNSARSGVESWDCILQTVLSGVKTNYSGLSGSPVISKNRIVGILQCQEVIDSGNNELKMATVNMFKKSLHPNVISENEYRLKLSKKTNEYTRNQIERNKSIKKYIPEIYVEELQYKEMVRYFADPALFIQKSLNELLRYDWKSINDVLNKYNLPLVNFQRYKITTESTSFFEDVIALCNAIEEAITNIENAEKSSNEPFYADKYGQKWTALYNKAKWFLKETRDLLKMVPTRYLLFLKEAGQGKTNFLCDFTDNFLLKRNYNVLYFNASELSDNPMDSMIQFLTLNKEYEISYVKKVLKLKYDKNKQPFIIVIDGLNENSHVSNFCNTIRSFLEKCKEFPFIKVIMTTRSEFYEERFGELTNGLYQSHFLSITMRKTHKEFDSRIFHGYLKHFNIGILKDTLLKSTYLKLTHNMLLLRFFCEVNAQKKNIPMYDVYIYDVFEMYTIEKCSRYSHGKSSINTDILKGLIEKIISQMIERHEYFSIPFKVFTDEETDLINKLLENEVLFKGESIVKTGLVPKRIETIGFTFDEYRDYCITNYIINHFNDEKALLQFVSQIMQNKAPVCEGVQKYLFFLSHTKYKEYLKGTVQHLPGYEDLYWQHIWSIDEKYIDNNDIVKCEEQIINKFTYMDHVMRNMIDRYDCTYYQKINIKLLMKIFDKLEETSTKYYDSIICRFPYIDQSVPWHYELEKDAVIRLNDILQKLYQDITEQNHIEHDIELVKLTVYLLSNKENKILDFWDFFYSCSKAKVYDVLLVMNSHSSQTIQKNTEKILSSILRRNTDLKLQELLDNNCYHIKNVTNLRDYITKLINDLEMDNEDL